MISKPKRIPTMKKPKEIPKTVSFGSITLNHSFIFENRLFVKITEHKALSVNPLWPAEVIEFYETNLVEKITFFQIKGSAGSSKTIRPVKVPKEEPKAAWRRSKHNWKKASSKPKSEK